MTKKNHILLGIHDGHDCSCCLMINGKIVYAAQEERFTKLKNDYGFPKKSYRKLLKVYWCKNK